MGLKQMIVDWLLDDYDRFDSMDMSLALAHERLNELEITVAADTEMLTRLDSATSAVAVRLSSLIEKVASLDAEVAADAQRDAEALRPYVEQLEKMGVNETEPVPPVEEPTNPETNEPAPAEPESEQL